MIFASSMFSGASLSNTVWKTEYTDIMSLDNLSLNITDPSCLLILKVPSLLKSSFLFGLLDFKFSFDR